MRSKDLPVKDRLLRFAAFIVFTVIFILEVPSILAIVGRSVLSFGRRAAPARGMLMPSPSLFMYIWIRLDDLVR